MNPFRAGLIALATFAGLTFAAEAGSGRKVVVELFTSQGCNSCPPADVFLGELAGRNDIVALGYHVDYWDYLGWKDTLAKPENTMRQEAYRKALGASSKYTPQMVVNGSDHAIGSDRASVNALVSAGLNKSGPAVGITMRMEKDKVVITAGKAMGTVNEANLVLVFLGEQQDVDVRRGENRGRTIAYVNPVRSFTTIGTWTGEEMRVELPLSEFAMHDAEGCAVLLQEKDAYGRPGTILAASHWSKKKAGL